MKLVLSAFLTLMPSALLAKTNTSCLLPLSLAGHVTILEPPKPVLPIEATKATEVATVVANTLSVLTLQPQGLSQGSRAFANLKMVSCDDASKPEEGALAWSDSPTQLSIGNNNTLQHNIGAVVGNWALFGGTVTAWAMAAKKFSLETAHYPGGLILPVLFLMTPTTSSAVTLLRQGTATEQVGGGFSITAQVLGTGLVAIAMHPNYFGAHWSTVGTKAGWSDKLLQDGYVKRMGLVFGDYGENRHWFIAPELLMSMATGILQSYQASASHCKDLLIASAAINTAYALSLIFLRPNMEPKERIFYAGLASVQAAALTTQAIAAVVTSKETQDKIRPITSGIMMVTEWALWAKSMWDLGRRIQSMWKFVSSKFNRVMVADLVRTNSPDGLDESLLDIQLDIQSESPPPGSGTPIQVDLKSSSLGSKEDLWAGIPPILAQKQEDLADLIKIDLDLLAAQMPIVTPIDTEDLSAITGGHGHVTGEFRNPFEATL